jgi:hypothetical protein
MICPPQEYQILIDSMENHQTNEYRLELDLVYVGYTTVRRTMQHIDPVKRKTRRSKKRKRDPNSPWAKSRLRWVMQLLATLGKHNFDPAAQDN